MTTPLEPTVRKRIRDSVSELIQRQVTPWLFMTVAPFETETFTGRRIRYSNIAFSGSPEDVFWKGYIEPFLERLCITEIEAVVAQCRERTVDARDAIPEVLALLNEGIARVYSEMVSVHQRLKSMENRPAGAAPDVTARVSRMQAFAREHADAQLKTFQHPSIWEQWYRRNQFWSWAVPTLISVVALASASPLGRPFVTRLGRRG
jgi:hypothetical protein